MNHAKNASKRGASYAEILRTKVTATTININNKKTKEMSTGDRTIHAVRLLYKGAWGLAYSTNPEYPKLITKALKNARLIKQKTKVSSDGATRLLEEADFSIDPRDMDIGDKKSRLLSLDKRARHPKVKSLNLNYADRYSERHIENTEGASATIRNVTTGLFSTAYAKQGSRIENYMSILRSRAGYELLQDAEKTVQESMRKATAMLKAKHAKGGLHKTLVDQYIAGVFAHEAIGHACEADAILSGSSILAGKIGKQIGESNTTIHDDGKVKGWGYTPVDSEGIEAKHTVLISKGVLNSYMHSRETAAAFKEETTGNGRSQDPTMKVIPRMTNTVIAPGDSSYDEMLQSIKKGYYLKGSAGGQVDPSGGDFLFNAKEGYYVENGKVKHMIKDVSLLGSILETLHNIKLIAADTKYDTGYCGKAGQAVPVSCASPHVLLDKAKIGGAQ